MAPNDKSSTIPAWQRATSLPGAEDIKAEPEPQPTKADAVADADKTAPTHESARSEESTSKDSIQGLREQAAQFLNDPTIKDAPRERKVAFLESKGLEKAEIDLLLSSQPSQSEAASAQSSSPSPQTPRDLPPVIAYPEFLVQSEKPPPLVTKTLLVNTAYVTAGIYGTLYALSKYIINPMQAQLSDARHELLTHSTNQLDVMNSRLSSLVSTVPSSRPGTALKTTKDELDDDDSDTSDPTELFHRDFGTQTSPSLSRRGSVSSPTDDPTSTSAAEKAEAKLKSISAHVKELTKSSETSTEKDDVSTELSQLVTTLNEMAYVSSSYYKYSSGAAGYGWATGEKAQDDEIERLVKDIKALKGKFLGVRNFPRASASAR